MPHSTAKALNLPIPSLVDREFSLRLKNKIIDKIKAEGDIAFSQYMQMALYENGLGYYVSGLRKFGEQGDFVTSPEISSLYGQTLARQIAEIFSNSTIDKVFELGAGTGKLAVDILTELSALNALPSNYIILDVSAEMQQRQKQQIAKQLPKLIERVTWLSEWPENINAVVIANEVLDAMPVERFLHHQDKISRQYVSVENNELKLVYKNADDEYSQQVKNKLEHNQQPYMSELSKNYQAWFSSLHNAINTGVLLFIDYGYPRKEYYLAERQQGTLMCFYRHHAHDDALLNPGLQDITAFVDFTSVVESATDAGFDFEGFVSQSDFLLANGITDILKLKMKNLDEITNYEYAKQLKQLTLPGEMGERFKVMGFSKNYQPEIKGFERNDQSHLL